MTTVEITSTDTSKRRGEFELPEEPAPEPYVRKTATVTIKGRFVVTINDVVVYDNTQEN